MNISSDPNSALTEDLLSKTELDAEIALSTLLENINNTSAALVRPDMEVLGNTFGGLKSNLKQVLNPASPPEQISVLRKAEGNIWNTVIPGADRNQGRIRAVLTRLIDFLWTRRAISKEEQHDAVLRAGRISHIVETTQALVDAITEARNDQRTPGLQPASGMAPAEAERLKNLLRQAELVSSYTKLWAVYENAWRQHVDEGTPLTEAVKAADAVVHSLYERISSDQQLRMRLPSQQLVTIFYESRVVTRVSRFPVQYIAAPYWGHKLIWNWLAFAHEIGHHAWANVGEESQDHSSSGLNIGDELLVHLTVYLLRETSSIERAIWSKWMEEIFADLFCLLFIGPAAIHSMQHMFFALPPQDLRQHLKTEDPRGWLRRAYDNDHPVPHLRVYLNIDMLRLLDSERFASEIDLMTRQWEMFFRGAESDTYTFSSNKIDAQRMRTIGRAMLNVILNTPLFALGRRNDPNEKRTLKEVFFDKEPSDLEHKVEKAQSALAARKWDECLIKLSNKEYEIRHLLAAVQFEFERLTNDSSTSDKQQTLAELSLRVIRVFKDYGDEQLLRGLQDKKQKYFSVRST